MPKFRGLQPVLMILVDLAAFFSALVLAILFRLYLVPLVFGAPAEAKTLYWNHLKIWWLPLVFITTIAYESLYHKRMPFWQETRQMLKATSMSILMVFTIVCLSRSMNHVSRMILVSMWFASLFLCPLFRSLARKLFLALNFWQENVLILGAGSAGITALKGLERETALAYNVIGFLDDDPAKIGTTVNSTRGEYRIFGAVRHFRKFVSMMKISTIIVAMPSLDSAAQARIVSEVQRYVPKVLLVPELKGVALMNTELRVLFMEQLFLLKIRNNLKSLYGRIVKRTFDLVVSSVGIILASPLLLGLYLAVKLTSRGGAIFSQFRPGKDGKIIRMYKFRTMYIDGDERLKDALKKDLKLAEEWRIYRKLKTYDPRVTPVGRFLRKCSLDELPQIFNVLKGEMSLVGPRPYMVSEIPALGSATDVIFLAKPGLCGLWQCSGRNNLSFEDRVKLESWYVLNWSLWLDLILMLKTARVVLTAEGAY